VGRGIVTKTARVSQKKSEQDNTETGDQGRRTEEEGETMAKYRGGKVWLWGEGH
jgi:hypothetical protein